MMVFLKPMRCMPCKAEFMGSQDDDDVVVVVDVVLSGCFLSVSWSSLRLFLAALVVVLFPMLWGISVSKMLGMGGCLREQAAEREGLGLRIIRITQRERVCVCVCV